MIIKYNNAHIINANKCILKLTNNSYLKKLNNERTKQDLALFYNYIKYFNLKYGEGYINE